MKRSTFFLLLAVLVAALVVASCATNQNTALIEAQRNAETGDYYVPENDVERRNYNWRQEVADDPSLILWCTFFPENPSAPMITVPILGKLTSGGKRPFAQYQYDGGENPGADGMYGSSGEYRYGFGPAGKYEYYDFYGVQTFCTTVPLVFQREETVIVMEKDPTLQAAGEQARQAMINGDPDLANEILLNAINEVQGGR